MNQVIILINPGKLFPCVRETTICNKTANKKEMSRRNAQKWRDSSLIKLGNYAQTYYIYLWDF